MTFLERVADDVSSAVARSSRIIARWALRRIVDLFNLFRTLIIFVPLIYIGAFGYELTYGHALLPRLFGWFLILATVGFILWSIYELFRRLLFRDTSDEEEAPFVSIGSSILTFVILLFLLAVHHEFQSPILAWTQSLPAEIKNALFNTHHDRASFGAERSSEVWLRSSSTPALAEAGETHLSLWVEGIHSTSLNTVLDVACKTWWDSESAILSDASGAYLLDQSGHKFDLTKDLGDYSFFSGERKIVGGETYRWSLVFPRIGTDVTALQLKHPQFQRVKISFGLEPRRENNGTVPTPSGVGLVPRAENNGTVPTPSGVGLVPQANIQVRLNSSEIPTQGLVCGQTFPWRYTLDISLKETKGIGVKLARILVDTNPYLPDEAGLPIRIEGGGESKGQLHFCNAATAGFDSTVTLEGVDDGGIKGSWTGTTRFPGTR